MIKKLYEILKVIYGNFDVFLANRLIMLGSNTYNANKMKRFGNLVVVNKILYRSTVDEL